MTRPAPRTEKLLATLRRTPGWIATAALLAIVVLRCTTVFSPQIYWDVDPRAAERDAVTGAYVPMIMYGPSGAAVCDVALVAVLALALADARLRRRRVHATLLGLWAIGFALALWHGQRDAESLRIGGHWIATLAAALAALHLGGEVLQRRVMIVGLMALAVPLGAQAAHQMTIEHAQTIEHYEQSREQFARERGWGLDSAELRRYEARLYQNEATGRFGFANVFASVVMTGSLVALGAALGAAFARRREDEDETQRLHRLGALAAACAIAAIGLATTLVTFSKGAVLAMGGAVFAAAALAAAARRVRLGPGVWGGAAVAVIVLACLGVVGRGMIGEPQTAAGERSLLFRYHYWQAAAGMLGEAPLVGVGPGRFQQHYLLHRNPLNPEEVTDPHNVFVAYAATLGIGGLAWGALVAAMLIGAGAAAGRAFASPESAARDGVDDVAMDAERTKDLRWSLALIAGLVGFGAGYAIDWPRYEIRLALVWVAAVGGWMAAACGLSGRRLLEGRWAQLGLFAAALGLVLHAQIEMSMTNAMAGPMLGATLGLAAARWRDDDDAASPRAACIAWSATAAAASLAVVMLILHTAPTLKQQALLERSVEQVRRGAIGAAVMQTMPAARDGAGVAPDPRLAVDEATLWMQGRRPTEAMTVLEDARRHGAYLANLWRTEALLSREAFRETGDEAWLSRAVDAAATAIEHDPHGLSAHQLAADLAYRAGRYDQAGRWYRRTLQINEQSYLDPNKQLTDDEVARITRRLELIDSPGPAGPNHETDP